MASKTLLRNGAALLNRLSLSNSKSLLHQPFNSNYPLPHLFPSLPSFPSFPQNDAESVKKLLSPEGFLYPCGLPSLRFFLPNGTISFTFSLHLNWNACIVIIIVTVNFISESWKKWRFLVNSDSFQMQISFTYLIG